MNKEKQISEALEKEESNIAFLSTLTDKELSEKLETIHLQMELAEKNKQTEAISLLEIWRSQVIAARIYKAENAIPDQLSELQQILAENEVMAEKSEFRIEKIIQEEKAEEPSPEPTEPPRQPDAEQLSLF